VEFPLILSSPIDLDLPEDDETVEELLLEAAAWTSERSWMAEGTRYWRTRLKFDGHAEWYVDGLNVYAWAIVHEDFVNIWHW
jgi:hypothetical protein